MTDGLGMAYLLAFGIGAVAGLRAMTAPAAITVAAHIDWLDLTGSWTAFFGNIWVHWLFVLLALGELVTDQLPSAPSRTVPVQLGARLISGAACGAAIGASSGGMAGGLAAGISGAVVGTLGGKIARARLAAAFGRDRPAALVEDAVAIGGAALIVLALG